MSERPKPAQATEKAQVALIELNRQEPPDQHARYQRDDPDADYYDGPSCETCETKGPKWCEEHGRLLIGFPPTTPAETGGGQ